VPFDPRAVYLRDCAVCHGARGDGTPRAPQIASAGGALTDYELSTGRMPIDRPDELIQRRPPRYSPDGIKALVDYVATFGGGGVPIPIVDTAHADVARGGELYRLNCAACHSWSGTGGALLGREAPSLTLATPVQVAEVIRTGPGSMPSFGRETMNDDDVEAVAAYVEELHHPQDRGGNPLLHLGPFPEGAVAWIIGIGAMLLFVTWVGEREPKA
jgi:ubiquinol-cytochrome c reductase cytochrome c subunit